MIEAAFASALAAVDAGLIPGAPLGDWPLGEGLSYGPSPDPATERCPWRGRVLKGEVHDENA